MDEDDRPMKEYAGFYAIGARATAEAECVFDPPRSSSIAAAR